MRAIRGPLGTNEERVYAHSAGFDKTGTPAQKRPSRTFVAALLLRTLEPLQAQAHHRPQLPPDSESAWRELCGDVN